MKSGRFGLVLMIAAFISTNGWSLWVRSEEGYDCKITCSEAGWVTPTTGKYKNTNRNFYICTADVNQEGIRAGYSLSHQSGCTVADEDQVVHEMDFFCMCG